MMRTACERASPHSLTCRGVPARATRITIYEHANPPSAAGFVRSVTLVAPAGALSEVATFPRVAELSSGLPSPQWASDHALTTAVLTHPPGPAERV